MFSAPIPGQSLTSEPKNSPWENPPQMNKPEEAVLWHLKKLDKPKSIKSVIACFLIFSKLAFKYFFNK